MKKIAFCFALLMMSVSAFAHDEEVATIERTPEEEAAIQACVQSCVAAYEQPSYALKACVRECFEKR
ncbi:MAG: hypothetical protein NDJ90_00725 [Oligoflexia bacterium]|nr:hypothetical protein [Oligoflexia bacterium]